MPSRCQIILNMVFYYELILHLDYVFFLFIGKFYYYTIFFNCRHENLFCPCFKVCLRPPLFNLVFYSFFGLFAFYAPVSIFSLLLKEISFFKSYLIFNEVKHKSRFSFYSLFYSILCIYLIKLLFFLALLLLNVTLTLCNPIQLPTVVF